MRKQLLAMTLVTGIALVIQLGCSGTVNPGGGTVNPPTGTVVVFGGDAPLCSILSFNMTITGMTLAPTSSSSPVSILPAGQSLTLDYASLMDYSAPITLASVPTGSYSALNLTLANAQLTYWDTTKIPAGPTTVSLTLPSLTVALDLSPTLTVSSSGASGLQLDFDLLHSVVLDQSNQITSNALSTFTVTPAALGGSNTYAEIEDLRGIVTSVTTTSSNPAYTGSFALQTPAGPTVTVNVSGSTKFDGVTGLSGLASGTFVQVDASIDSRANLLANEVQAEEHEDAANGQAAFKGFITSVTRDSSGNATQFNLFVSEEAPDVSSQVSLQSVLIFNVLTSTNFAITAQAQASNLANFTFNPQTLGIGQQVVAHGQLPAPGTSPFTADARAIYLGTQSILGNLSTAPSTPVVTGSDGKTGGFTLVPCSPLYSSSPPITEISFLQTHFTGTGLTNLNSLELPGTHFLLVKGILSYQQTTGNKNGVAWVPPANVQAATEVHQLPQ
jgi:hypothetical protein